MHNLLSECTDTCHTVVAGSFLMGFKMSIAESLVSTFHVPLHYIYLKQPLHVSDVAVSFDFWKTFAFPLMFTWSQCPELPLAAFNGLKQKLHVTRIFTGTYCFPFYSRWVGSQYICDKVLTSHAPQDTADTYITSSRRNHVFTWATLSIVWQGVAM